MAITLTIESAGQGTCALTGKTDADGLTVAFENEAPCFVSWRGFKQLVSFRAAQAGKPDAKPSGHPSTAAPAPPARQP